MSLIVAIRRNTVDSFRTVPCILLLAFYAAGTSQMEGLKQFFHSHEHSISHSEEQEEIPCHRAIHHQDSKSGCGHNSHIVSIDKCAQCDLSLPSDQILFSAFDAEPVYLFSTNLTFCSFDIACNSCLILPSRAPPAV